VTAGTTVIIRYQTHPDAADENSRLVEAVFDSLSELKPHGLSYTTYRLADGVSFVHIAHLDGDANPLTTLPAFIEFQGDLAHRCRAQPVLSKASAIGTYAPNQ
jgi:hypothetical protein